MKSISTVLLYMLMVSLVKAQLPVEKLADRAQYNEEIAQFQLHNEATNKPGLQNESYKAGGDTIWYEDFGNGIPATWTILDSSNICPWKYSLDGTWGYFNGNSGTGPSDDTLQSATMSNGFLICDVDSANNVTNGQPSGDNYQYLSSYFTTDAIDLTGFPVVFLQFEHFFRFNNNIDLRVSVSSDGTNWTDFTVQGNASNNTASGNAESVNLNISSVGGNQSTVYIRIGWSARVYFWMIDDIRIVEAPGNDLSLTTEQYYPFYKMTPVKQTTGMAFTGTIVNNGGNTQTNVELNATVTHTGDTTFNGNSAPFSSTPGAIDTVSILDSSYAPSLLGDYSIEYSISYDSTDFNSGDNTMINGFQVTDTVYARDNGGYTGWGVRTGTTGNSKRGIMYEIWQQDTVTSMSVLITGSTPDNNQIIQFHLYDTSLAFPLATSAFHTIETSDIGNWVTVPFDDFALPPGQYVAVVESFTDSVYVHFDPGAPLPLPQTSFYLSSGGTWYYSASYTYYVRMHTKRPACDANLTISTTSATCDSSDAEASVVVTGGLAPYTYTWNTSPPQSGDSASGLSAGAYSILIYDGLGCTYSKSVSIADSGAAVLSTSFTNVTCSGAGDGTASVSASGAAPPLTYTWSNGVNDSVLSNVIGGIYNVTVANTDNCSSVATVTITEPSAIVLDIIATTDEMDSLGNGSITTSVAGGSGGNTYSWNTDPVQTTASAINLPAGTYTCSVTDMNGCQDSVTATIALVIGVREGGADSKLIIYPNPTTGLLHIELGASNDGQVVIELFDILGERILSKISDKSELILDLSRVKAGVYFLKVRDSEGTYTHKIVRND